MPLRHWDTGTFRHTDISIFTFIDYFIILWMKYWIFSFREPRTDKVLLRHGTFMTNVLNAYSPVPRMHIVMHMTWLTDDIEQICKMWSVSKQNTTQKNIFIFLWKKIQISFIDLNDYNMCWRPPVAYGHSVFQWNRNETKRNEIKYKGRK